MKLKISFFANPFLPAALKSLQQERLPAKVAYKVDKNLQVITRGLKRVAKQFEEVKKPYLKPGSADEILPEKVDEFLKRNEEFGQEELEFDLKPLTLKEIENVLMTPAELSALKPFLVELELVSTAPDTAPLSWPPAG